MEAIISQAMFDTVFLQITLPSSGTSTLQATSRFPLRLLLQVTHLDNLEVTLALLVWKHRHFYFRLDRLIRYNIKEVRLALFKFQATSYIFHILAVEKSVNRSRSQFTLAYTFNDRLRAQLRITTCKDSVAIRHVVMRICLDS